MNFEVFVDQNEKRIARRGYITYDTNGYSWDKGDYQTYNPLFKSKKETIGFFSGWEQLLGLKKKKSFNQL